MSAMLVVIAVLVGLATGAPTAQALSKVAQLQLPSGERVFIETDTRRQLIFHGVNAIVKGFPYVPSTTEFDIDISLVEKDHSTLESLGVNVYRLGTMWKGAEPKRGQYNQTYFDELRKIVQDASRHNIYSLLGMHQDVISEAVCGEGVPDWAADLSTLAPAKAFPAPLADPYTAVASDEYPTRQDCSKFNWPSYYNTYANGAIFEALYDTSPSATTLPAWASYWAQVAKQLGQESAVLGYELINEPWSGDALTNPKLLLPGVGDREKLQPAYDVLAPAIRAVDNTTLIFFAAVTWDDIVPVGFQHPPGGAGQAPGSVLAFHYYEPPQGNQHTYFNARTRDAQRLQVGMFLSEFERAQDSDDLSDPFIATADAADEYGLSWTMWEYKTFCKETDVTTASDSQAAAFGSCKTGYGGRELWNEDGTLKTPAAKKLARTYAPKVAGVVRKMRFDASTGDFMLVWSADPTITAPTEIFLHEELQYPSGFEVEISPKDRAVWSKTQTNRIAIFTTRLVAPGDTIVLTIHAVR